MCFFDKAFLQNTAANIIGVFVGLILGLYINRIIEKWQRKRETEIKKYNDQENAIKILYLLKDEINKNITLLEQMDRELNPVRENTIFYNLDMSVWNSISLVDLRNIVSVAIIKEISRIYYEFEHLRRKIDVQFQLHYGPLRAAVDYLSLRSSIVIPIIEHARRIHRDCLDFIPNIDNETEKLNQSK